MGEIVFDCKTSAEICTGFLYLVMVPKIVGNFSKNIFYFIGVNPKRT